MNNQSFFHFSIKYKGVIKIPADKKESIKILKKIIQYSNDCIHGIEANNFPVDSIDIKRFNNLIKDLGKTKTTY